MQLHELTALEQGEGIRRGDFSALELTKHYLSRIERLNAVVGAFITVTSDMAIAQSMLAQFPQLRATFARTNEDLLATDAKVMLCADTNVRGRWAAAHRGAGQLGPG